MTPGPTPSAHPATQGAPGAPVPPEAPRPFALLPQPLPLAEAIRHAAALAAAPALAEAPPVRVLVLRGVAVEPVDPFLRLHLLNAGLRPDIRFGGYDTPLQDAAEAVEFDPDLVLFAFPLESLEPEWRRVGFDGPALAARLTGWAEGVRERLPRALLLLHTLPRPLEGEGGPAGLLEGDGPDARLAAANAALLAYARQRRPGVLVCDWERLLMRVGTAEALDARLAQLYRAPFRAPFLDAWGREAARVAMALKGRGKKVLVLDCDNTLWGGVVGEEGVEGVALDRHAFPGRAFRSFQQVAARLQQRGVLLALCSKNNPEDVWEMFERHPEMVLTREMIAAHRIGWEEKPAGLAALAAELNLGRDSLVFYDDNPVECGMVAALLPEVTVRQVPAALETLPGMLAAEWCFDTLGTTGEDRQRTALYAAEARRREERDAQLDLGAYLAALGTRAAIHPMTPAELPRVVQLIGKTNQFNLTTRRHGEGAVRSLAAGPDSRVYTLTVSDRHGPLGLTGVLIAVRRGEELHIESLLLSCRVLKRGLEEAFTGHCLGELLAAWRPQRVVAEYLPTAKNGQVRDFWPRFGLAPAVLPHGAGAAAGAVTFAAPVAQLTLPLVAHVAINGAGGPDGH